MYYVFYIFLNLYGLNKVKQFFNKMNIYTIRDYATIIIFYILNRKPLYSIRKGRNAITMVSI